MRSKSFFVMAVVLVCIGFTEVQAADYKWNDGGVHNFSGSLGGGRVYNNTTLNILNNGDIGHLEVEDTGTVNVLGSTANITNLSAFYNSEITITDGTVGLNCWDGSTTTVTGGTITRGFYSRAIIPIVDSSRLDIYGGSFVNNLVVGGSGF